jgi:SMC interacting uncharacterized protein involved in chromosome segregation
MEEHKSALEQKVKERTAELEVTNRKLETMAEEISTLKEQVQSQDLTVEDVRKMQSEQLRVREALDRAIATRQQQKDALWESDVELKKLFDELETVVDAYNARVSELALVLPDAERVSTFKIKIDKENADAADQSLLLGVDLFTDVRPYLSRNKTDMEQEMGTLRRELQEELSTLETIEEAFTEALDKLKVSCSRWTCPDIG